MNATRTIVVVVTFLLLVGSNAAAQSSIAGTVRDTSGGVMPGVTVEVTSPALIEKIRTTVTDEAGQYRIIDLRPGVYAVTFSLPGFAAVKREGVELTAAFTAPVNAEMRVGDVAETITVTGESPVVDIQSVVKQRELTRDVLDTIPRGTEFAAIFSVIPGATSSYLSGDVGGQATGIAASGIKIHGSRTRDLQWFFDGAKITDLPRNDATNFQAQNETIQEYNIQIAGQSAENETNGLHFNLIPKEGANVFKGSFFTNFTNSDLASDNYTDELRSLGLGSRATVKTMYDINPTLGGPLKEDKLWFYAGLWRWRTDTYVGGRFHNTDVTSWTYTPDLGRPAVNEIYGWGAGDVPVAVEI